MTESSAQLRYAGQSRPAHFCALQELYERNFQFMRCLIPNPERPFDVALSYSGSDLPLRAEVISQSPYTGVFQLRYDRAVDADGAVLQPNLQVRMYHDAHLAEALTCPNRPGWLCDDPEADQARRYFDALWERNLLLNKWLDYLLAQGHLFALAGRSQALKAQVA